MAILKNRPLFSACLLYIICAFSAPFAPPFVKLVLFCVSAVAGVVCLLLLFMRKLPRKILICAIIALLCLALAFGIAYAAFDLGMQKYQKIAEKESCTVQATVTSRLSFESITIYQIRVHKIDGQAQHMDAQLLCEFAAYLQVGDRFEAQLEPSLLTQGSSLYKNPYQKLADGMRMQFTCENESMILDVTKDHATLQTVLSKLNDSLCQRVISVCGEQSGGLVCALLLGNKGYLQGTLSRDFERVGASHMLALSGMHVSILIGALGWLLSRLRVHRKARAVFLALASVSYLVLTGFSVSATRAVVMVCILQLSYLLASDNDTLTTLGVVGVGILLADPFSVCDTGFVLSFLATFGIVVLVPPLHSFLSERAQSLCKPPHLKFKRIASGILAAVLETLLIGVIACFAIMVPSCYLIGSTSWLSPVTTLLLSPIVSALLVLGALALLCSPILPLANIFGTLIRLLYAMILPYVQGASQIDGVLLPLSHTAVRVLSVLFCCGMLVLLVLPVRKKLLLALPPAALVLSLCIFFPIHTAGSPNTLQAAYTHASSLSESVVSTEGYRAYVCDLSSGSSTSAYYAMHAAGEMGATEIGALLLTDYHVPQGAALHVLLSGYKTDLIYMPHTTDPEDARIQAFLCEIAQMHGVAVAFYEYGKPLAWNADSQITVYREDLARSAQPILVVTLQKGDACITAMSAAAEHSALAEHAEAAIRASDAIVCMERGPSPRLTFGLEGAQDADVVFGSRTLASFCDPDSLGGARSMTVCPEIAYFSIATKQQP